MNRSPHSSHLRLHRQVYEPGHCFFVTKCLYPRLKILVGQPAAEISAAVCFYAKHGNIHLAAFAVMPDHWHALLAPNGKTLPELMNNLSRWITRQTSNDLRGCVWQDGYYETLICTAKQFEYVADYIELNPVRAGLVENKQDWEWSSANPKYSEHSARPWPWHFDEEG